MAEALAHDSNAQRVPFDAVPLALVSHTTLSLESHRKEVDCLQFSRDGSTLFVARYPTIFVTRASDGAVLDEIDIGNPDIDAPDDDDGYSERVRAITESADGATLFVLCETMVSNSGDMFGWVQAHARVGGARLWTAPSPDDAIPAPLDEETGVLQVVCSPDGDRVALVSLDGVLFVSSRTGKKRATITWNEDVAPYDHIAAAAFNEDGSRLWLVWAPQMRCYDEKRKLVRIVETTEDVALYDYGTTALISVRPADGRLTVLTRDRKSLVVVHEKEESVVVRALGGDGASTAHALLDHGERWLRSGSDNTGPIAIESTTDIRVLEETDDAPREWNALAVREGPPLLVARAHGSKLWVHRAVLD